LAKLLDDKKYMNFEKFVNLTPEEQSESVFVESVEVATYQDNDYDYVLYQLHSFYVEKKYSRITQKLLYVVAFDCSSKLLDVYLKRVKLTAL